MATAAVEVSSEGAVKIATPPQQQPNECQDEVQQPLPTKDETAAPVNVPTTAMGTNKTNKKNKNRGNNKNQSNAAPQPNVQQVDVVKPEICQEKPKELAEDVKPEPAEALEAVVERTPTTKANTPEINAQDAAQQNKSKENKQQKTVTEQVEHAVLPEPIHTDITEAINIVAAVEQEEPKVQEVKDKKPKADAKENLSQKGNTNNMNEKEHKQLNKAPQGTATEVKSNMVTKDPKPEKVGQGKDNTSIGHPVKSKVIDIQQEVVKVEAKTTPDILTKPKEEVIQDQEQKPLTKTIGNKKTKPKDKIDKNHPAPVKEKPKVEQPEKTIDVTSLNAETPQPTTKEIKVEEEKVTVIEQPKATTHPSTPKQATNQAKNKKKNNNTKASSPVPVMKSEVIPTKSEDKPPSQKCPYEHPIEQPKDLPQPPKITEMLFETMTKESKIIPVKEEPKKADFSPPPPWPVNKLPTQVLSFAAALKDPGPHTTDIDPPKLNPVIQEKPVQKGLMDLEAILEEIPLDEKSPESDTTITDNLSMQSMSDSTISDLTVVVEKSLDNIANVPDEEIMKLFDIVSKDFEKTPEPRERPKPMVFQEPIEQAGAALATLIEAVEKTESRIKERVEETKKKQKQSRFKKSKSNTPEKVLNNTPKRDKKAADILVDAVIVERQSTEEDPEKTITDSPRKSPSSDPKNVQRSDFVQSVEAQQQDGTNSLLNKDEPKSEAQNPVTPPHPKDKTASPHQPPAQEKLLRPTASSKPIVPPRPESTKKPNKKSPQAQPLSTVPKWTTTMAKTEHFNIGADDDYDDDDEEEEYIEYKFSSRKVFMLTTCHSCQCDLRAKVFACPNCAMIYYCSEKHYQEDLPNHTDYCQTIQEVAKKRGGHVYNESQQLSPNDFRNLRVHTLNICASNLKRPLQPFEKEMLLFPRLCVKPDCKNWKFTELASCPKCHQVAFCKARPDHLLQTHAKWCSSFNLYQKLVLSKRIEPPMPNLILTTPLNMPSTMEDLLKTLYRAPIKDACSKVVLSQLATGPLTALNAIQRCKVANQSTMVIHLIGAELQFEGDTLDKWEAFFLHLVPGLTELRVVFVGPELNVENLPVEILSRIRCEYFDNSSSLNVAQFYRFRMCRNCRMVCPCRNVKFDFQCRTLYHDYAKSSAFTKPDLSKRD